MEAARDAEKNLHRRQLPRALPGWTVVATPTYLDPDAIPGHIRGRQRGLLENKANKEAAN